MTGASSWVFLNKEGKLDEIGWDGPQREKLWRYNQHYFDDLNAQGAIERIAWHSALIEDWIAHNPPGEGNAWEPYPLSLRIVNWIKWVLSGAKISDVTEKSLAIQVRWLTCRLENHLLGNHLFANAKALIMAGCFFEGPEADVWLVKGFHIIAQEIVEQLLPDGGHFERSTMYHALILEDLLDLINIANCFAFRLTHAQRQQVSGWLGCARKMHYWLHVMCHPDGEFGFFNDAAFDIAPTFDEIDAYARLILSELKKPEFSRLEHLKDSGYIRLAHGPAVALLDVAPLGPDYLLGHAHADTLSFELSVGGQRLLVNSGTSCYGNSIERLRQRSTVAHNTVEVDGQNSSEVWGSFRVARRAYPRELKIKYIRDISTTEVHCMHDGYTRFPGQAEHHRIWCMDETGLTIIDKVQGAHSSAVARFYFHPIIQVSIGQNSREGFCLMPDGTVICWNLQNGIARLETSTWHPRFGHSEFNKCLYIKLIKGFSSLRFCWVPSETSL